MKKLIITEKPSVADEFMKILEPGAKRRNGKYEGDKYIITWCIGHLMTLCMPERYGEQYEKWSLEVLPFIPERYKYEAITSVKEQLSVVTDCIRREDIDTIYYAGMPQEKGNTFSALSGHMLQENFLSLKSESGLIPRPKKKSEKVLPRQNP